MWLFRKRAKGIYGYWVVILILLVVVFLVGCKNTDTETTETATETESETTPEVKQTQEEPQASNILEKLMIMRYQIDEGVNDYGYLEVSFMDSVENSYRLQVLLDLNGDNEYDNTEWVVQNQPVSIKKGFPNRFSFELPAMLKGKTVSETIGAKAMLTVGLTDNINEVVAEEVIEGNYEIATYILKSEFGMDVPGASEDLKRGVGKFMSSFDGDFERVGQTGEGVPDLSGGAMDCFAIATANNLINMASQNDRLEDLPTNPQALVDELKTIMNYKDGITNSNFLKGKNEFVKKYKLPIRTEEIKKPTIEDLAEAFANGDAVEISTTMIRSQSGRDNTGHVFTGINAFREGGNAGLSVHDPATPEGTDTMRIRMSDGENQYILLDYPMWDGIVFVDAIYVQTWDDSIDTSETALMIPEVELAFAHVKPGQYSEVYASVTRLTPGTEVTAFLTGGGQNQVRQIVEADQNGVAYFTWRIYQYGDYDVKVVIEGQADSDVKITVK